MSAKKSTEKSGKTDTGESKASGGFSKAEREAMQERAKELKAEARAGRSGKAAAAEAALIEKIAEMSEPDRGMAERLHALIMATAPNLAPRTWYGMPAYSKDGKVVCFFQAADKFDARYATLGFSDQANLDDGSMWPTSFALKELTPAVEDRIADLVTRAVG